MAALKVLPLVAAFAILALASGAHAEGSPKLSTWYRWQCYVPGCLSCKQSDPMTCEVCDTSKGFQLNNGTCGCAAGYGSYAVPATRLFPYNPPVCPVYDTYSRSLWNKPYWCSAKYYGDNICQDSPALGRGYCQCFKCPPGYTSTGGPVQSAICAPGTTPPTPTPTPRPRGLCKGLPPVAANANPWTQASSWYSCKSHPRLQLLNRNGQCAATCKAGTVPSPTAPMATCIGKSWVITGACAPPAPSGPTCPGTPPTGTNAKAWPLTCKDGKAGDKCEADCKPGFEGPKAVATCDAKTGQWSVVSSCIKSKPAGCKDQPEQQENAEAFECTIPGELGQDCEAQCKEGFTGSVAAMCLQDGWKIENNCEPDTPDAPTCAGFPDDASADGGKPWDEGVGDPSCEDAEVGSICTVGCETGTNVEFGSVIAECVENEDGTAAWEYTSYCNDDPNGKKKRGMIVIKKRNN